MPGVQKVQRLGGVEREVRVALRADRLEALRLGADQVNAQLLRANANVPGGRAAGAEQSIRALGSAARALGATPIALPDGRWTRLDDIAVLRDGAGEARTRARLDGQEVVGFAVFRARGPATRASRRAWSTPWNSCAASTPTSTSSRCPRPWPTLASYDAAIMTLVEGAALTVLVVFLFLRSWRATLVAAIALPLSILPAFAVMAWFGYTLNSITLLALTLVIGILVDDAIVEIENIERHLDMGKRPYRAALDASDAIGFAVVAITATIVAVFLPVSFIGGFVGQYFAPFGVTVSAAVLASLLVARLVTPLMAAYLLAPPPAGQRQEAGHATGLLGRYLRMLDWALRHRRKSLALAAAFLAASLALAPLLPSGFMPVSDLSLSRVDVFFPPGTPLSQTDGKLDEMAARLRQRPEVRAVFTTGRRGRVRRDRRRQRAIADPAGAGRPARTQPEGVRACRAAATGRVPRHALCLPRRQRGARRVDHPGRRGCRRPVAAAHALERDMRALPGLANVQVRNRCRAPNC